VGVKRVKRERGEGGGSEKKEEKIRVHKGKAAPLYVPLGKLLYCISM
jgi:hypothetical protein